MFKTRIMPIVLLTALTLGVGAIAAPSAAAQRAGGGFFIGGKDFGVGFRFGDHGHGRHRRHHVHSHRCAIQECGYWETVTERVWVEGYWKEVCRPAEYGYYTDGCGRRVRYVVRPACDERVWCEGRWDLVTRRVWREGRVRYTCGY